MSLNPNTAMDALGTALRTITGLRVYDYPADAISAPAAIVELEAIEYDAATSRLADRAVFKVYVAVGTAPDRVSRDLLMAYLDGTGPATSSVKTAVDAIGGATVRVVRADVTPITVAGSLYKAAAVFEIDFIS